MLSPQLQNGNGMAISTAAAPAPNQELN